MQLRPFSSRTFCTSFTWYLELASALQKITLKEVAGSYVKVDEVRGTKHCVELASMAYFDFSGTVEVRVVHNRGAVEAARVRPLSQGIKPSVQGDTLTFSLSRPANLSVEVNGDIFHNLHLFANPLDARRPSAKEIKRAGRKGSKLVYFAPGVHRLPGDTLRVASGSTVYVDGGARVLGTLIVLSLIHI